MANQSYKSVHSGAEIDEQITFVKNDLREKLEQMDEAISKKVDDIDVVQTSERNQPNGFAGLDENGKVPTEILPPSSGGDVDLTDYVKNTDYANGTTAGVVKIYSNYGVTVAGGNLRVQPATKDDLGHIGDESAGAGVKERLSYSPIVGNTLHYAVEVCTNQDSEAELTEAQLRLPASTQFVKNVVGDIETSLDRLSDIEVGKSTALNGLFKLTAFTKGDVSAEYSAFKKAFNIPDWEIVREISADEIVVGANNFNAPYYQASTQRMIYPLYDIPYEDGYLLKITADVDTSNMNVAWHFFDEVSFIDASVGNYVNAGAHYHDTGWSLFDTEFKPPENTMSNPRFGVRIIMRYKDNRTITTIPFNKLTISRKAVD